MLDVVGAANTAGLSPDTVFWPRRSCPQPRRRRRSRQSRRPGAPRDLRRTPTTRPADRGRDLSPAGSGPVVPPAPAWQDTLVNGRGVAPRRWGRCGRRGEQSPRDHPGAGTRSEGSAAPGCRDVRHRRRGVVDRWGHRRPHVAVLGFAGSDCVSRCARRIPDPHRHPRRDTARPPSRRAPDTGVLEQTCGGGGWPVARLRRGKLESPTTGSPPHPDRGLARGDPPGGPSALAPSDPRGCRRGPGCPCGSGRRGIPRPRSTAVPRRGACAVRRRRRARQPQRTGPCAADRGLVCAGPPEPRVGLHARGACSAVEPIGRRGRN